MGRQGGRRHGAGTGWPSRGTRGRGVGRPPPPRRGLHGTAEAAALQPAGPRAGRAGRGRACCRTACQPAASLADTGPGRPTGCLATAARPRARRASAQQAARRAGYGPPRPSPRRRPRPAARRCGRRTPPGRTAGTTGCARPTPRSGPLASATIARVACTSSEVYSSSTASRSPSSPNTVAKPHAFDHTARHRLASATADSRGTGPGVRVVDAHRPPTWDPSPRPGVELDPVDGVAGHQLLRLAGERLGLVGERGRLGLGQQGRPPRGEHPGVGPRSGPPRAQPWAGRPAQGPRCGNRGAGAAPPVSDGDGHPSRRASPAPRPTHRGRDSSASVRWPRWRRAGAAISRRGLGVGAAPASQPMASATSACAGARAGGPRPRTSAGCHPNVHALVTASISARAMPDPRPGDRRRPPARAGRRPRRRPAARRGGGRAAHRQAARRHRGVDGGVDLVRAQATGAAGAGSPAQASLVALAVPAARACAGACPSTHPLRNELPAPAGRGHERMYVCGVTPKHGSRSRPASTSDRHLGLWRTHVRLDDRRP